MSSTSVPAVDATGRVERHELEPLRRSLAIGSGLPADQIERLIATCSLLYARLEAIDAVRADLAALRPVVAELRARLTGMDRVTAPSDGIAGAGRPRPTGHGARLTAHPSPHQKGFT